MKVLGGSIVSRPVIKRVYTRRANGVRAGVAETTLVTGPKSQVAVS